MILWDTVIPQAKMSSFKVYVCVTCGAQFPESSAAPSACPICEDERQYVRKGGQKWITRTELFDQHDNVWQEEEPGVTGIGTQPSFAIGQRALLVQTGA